MLTDLDLPAGPFDIIYADPPWQFKNYSDKWHDGRKGSRWVGNQYPLMTAHELYNIVPVQAIASDNSVLLMWTTFPHLHKAPELMSAWGFTYKTVAFVWCKTTKHGKEHVGQGFYTRSNAEIVLLGTRGKILPRRSRSVRQIVHAPVGRHSAKPPVVRDRIVELFGDIPRIELFARERADGWEAWGNEV